MASMGGLGLEGSTLNVLKIQWRKRRMRSNSSSMPLTVPANANLRFSSLKGGEAMSSNRKKIWLGRNRGFSTARTVYFAGAKQENRYRQPGG
jgi:hypothetical protein